MDFIRQILGVFIANEYRFDIKDYPANRAE